MRTRTVFRCCGFLLGRRGRYHFRKSLLLGPFPKAKIRNETTIKNSLIWWGVADAVTRGPPAATKGPEEYRSCLYPENPGSTRVNRPRLEHCRAASLGVNIAVSVPSTAMQPPDPLIRCAICGKPILLEQSKVNEDGKAVHEECYVAKMRGQKPKPQ